MLWLKSTSLVRILRWLSAVNAPVLMQSQHVRAIFLTLNVVLRIKTVKWRFQMINHNYVRFIANSGKRRNIPGYTLHRPTFILIRKAWVYWVWRYQENYCFFCISSCDVRKTPFSKRKIYLRDRIMSPSLVWKGRKIFQCINFASETSIWKTPNSLNPSNSGKWSKTGIGIVIECGRNLDTEEPLEHLQFPKIQLST